MTDARFVEGFLTNSKVDAISDGAYRAYVNSICWSVAQGMDGFVPRRALRLLHPDGARNDITKELLDSNMWELRPDGIQVHDFLDYQTPAAQVEQARELARLRKQRQREREQEKERDKVTRDSARDSAGDQTRDLQGKDRTGKDQDRTGAFEAEPSVSEPGEYLGGPVPWTRSA